MFDSNRWKLAQNYEKNWWEKQAEGMDLSFYKGFADQVTEVIKPFLKVVDTTRILEIGSGAAGIVTHLNSKYRWAVDPLEDFYADVKKFADYRDKNVIYKKALGESLPFEGKQFDLIIIDNVLDHCDNPALVISEMKRVLKENGIVFFRQNTYHIWGKFIRTIMEFFKIDKGHPHTFTKKSLIKLLTQSNFEILDYRRGGYFKTWLREIKSSRLIDKVKALLLVNRDKVTMVLKNR
jgi:SAM-dependent methyltransferase